MLKASPSPVVAHSASTTPPFHHGNCHQPLASCSTSLGTASPALALAPAPTSSFPTYTVAPLSATSHQVLGRPTGAVLNSEPGCPKNASPPGDRQSVQSPTTTTKHHTQLPCATVESRLQAASVTAADEAQSTNTSAAAQSLPLSPESALPLSPAHSGRTPPQNVTISATEPVSSSPAKRRKSDAARPADCRCSNCTSAANGQGDSSECSLASHDKHASSDNNVCKRPRASTEPKVLPLRYDIVEIDDLVNLISHMLIELIETNDRVAMKSGKLTRFHSRVPPGISVKDYLLRISKHATLLPAIMLSMIYYADRLCSLYPDFTLNTLTVHRFLITAATVASKGLSDSFWNNTTYARVGGIKVQELRTLEIEFLTRLDWKIVPQPEVLAAYYRGLVDRCPDYMLEATACTMSPQPHYRIPSITSSTDNSSDDDDISDDLDENDTMSNPGPQPTSDPELISGTVLDDQHVEDHDIASES